MNEQEEVYLKDGSTVLFHEKLSTGYVIERICEYTDWEGEQFLEPSGSKEIVDNIFSEPPVNVFSDQMKLAKEKLEGVEKEISEATQEKYSIQSETRDAKKEYEDLVTVLSRVPVLKNIERILNGDVTYFAYLTGWRNKYAIKEINETYNEDARDSWDRGMKLLSLFGDSKGNLSFQLNKYRDGSGNDEEVIPCFSIEEGQELIRDQILKEMDKSVIDKKVSYDCSDKVKFMDSNKFDFPISYRKMHDEYTEKNRLSNVKSLTESLERTKVQLRELNVDI